MKKKLVRIVLYILGILVLVCLGGMGISALVNRGLPQHSTVVDSLTQGDLLRAAESTHLRKTLGDDVWIGWGSADIPLILYNESYAFLLDLDNPAKGWVKVPETTIRGIAWEVIPDGGYYRQPVQEADRIIGAFTVKIGERWTAAFGTREWSQIGFYRGFGKELPPMLRDIFPYPLASRLLLGDSGRYISGLLHEEFHAYQGMTAPERLIGAENVARLEKSYPWDEDKVKQGWKDELGLLVKAAQSGSVDETRDVARQFLAGRAERRRSLSPEMIQYERQREWLEGLAKYAELTIGLKASQTHTYTPIKELAEADADFKGYASFASYYKGQIQQMSMMLNQNSEVIFYYSGFAQAVILDKLDPGWKARVVLGDVDVEDLLAEIVGK